jgi:HlyD family secretion protein
MIRKKWIAGFFLVGAGAGLFYWNSHRTAQAQSGAEQKIVTVDRGDVRAIVSASGRISPNYEVDIKCKASGVVTTLPYDVADVVKKDSLVLALDPVDEERNVKKQQAALESAQCRRDNAQQALQMAEQTYETDKRQAEIALHSAQISAADLRSKARRAKELNAQGQLSGEESESAETAALTAESAVDNAKNAIEALKTRPILIEQDKNEVRLAQLAIQSAEADLKDAEQRLKDTSVTAPIDGVVTTRPAQIGTIVSSGITTVNGGTSVMTLVDLSRLFVLAPVDEADIGRVKLGQNTVIRCDAFPDKTFEGKIIRISAKGTNTMSVITFEVKMEVLGEGKELLKPEMSTDIEIVVASRQNVLRIPTEAVLTRDKTRNKYVLIPAPASQTAASAPATAPDPNAPVPTEERDVEIGADDGTYCEILSGLAEGDKVVIAADSQAAWSKLKVN